MAQVALVFVAHVFEQVAVGIQAKVFGDGPGAYVGDGVFEMAVLPADTFGPVSLTNILARQIVLLPENLVCENP